MIDHDHVTHFSYGGFHMTSTRRVLGAIALVAALSGVAACGPDDSNAGGASGSSSAPSDAPAKAGKAGKGGSGGSGSDGSSSQGPSDDVDGDGKGGDCGAPPKMPAGHTMLHLELMRDAGGFEATVAVPHCSPNDWIYGGGNKKDAKHYVLPTAVKAELAINSTGAHKRVTHDQLAMHIDGCLADELGDTGRVKEPYGCYGNIYDVTLDAKGKVATMKEIWHP
ncbi:hypothetical protein ACWCP6_17400 [Streptomyces sp. NPDC002004]